MERILYLFLYRHRLNNRDIEASRQYEWIHTIIKDLSDPNRTYFDSLDFASYKGVIANAKKWVEESRPIDNLSFEQQMILRMYKKRIKIEPTEDTQLLNASFQRANEIDRRIKNNLPVPGSYAWELINERDEFIARQIDKTLKSGEIAFFFQGVNHQIDRFLAPDIKLGVYAGYVATERDRLS